MEKIEKTRKGTPAIVKELKAHVRGEEFFEQVKQYDYYQEQITAKNLVSFFDDFAKGITHVWQKYGSAPADIKIGNDKKESALPAVKGKNLYNHVSKSVILPSSVFFKIASGYSSKDKETRAASKKEAIILGVRNSLIDHLYEKDSVGYHFYVPGLANHERFDFEESGKNALFGKKLESELNVIKKEIFDKVKAL